MGTKIEWVEESWNPIAGCSKCSPGCLHCYAERMAHRLAGMGNDNPQYLGKTDAAGHWTGKVECCDWLLDKPRHWRKPRRIFVNSMSDTFHPNVPRTFIGKIIDVATRCKQHTFLLLTKRPENADWPIYPPNLWLGVSVCNQQEADEKIPILLQIPAAKRFVSLEPLLGPVDLHKWALPQFEHITGLYKGTATEFIPLDWVIVGGESGPGARPMHPDWPRGIRDQCKAAGVAFFFKQWGEYYPWSGANAINPVKISYRPMDADAAILPDGQVVYRRALKKMSTGDLAQLTRGGAACFTRLGKKKAGNVLDGKLYEEYPK